MRMLSLKQRGDKVSKIGGGTASYRTLYLLAILFHKPLLKNQANRCRMEHKSTQELQAPEIARLMRVELLRKSSALVDRLLISIDQKEGNLCICFEMLK